jgi:hypothetical protein
MRNTKVSLEYVYENYDVSLTSAYEILQMIADSYIYGGEQVRNKYFHVVDVNENVKEYYLKPPGELYMDDLVGEYEANYDDATALAYAYRRFKANGDLLSDSMYSDFL